MLLKTLSTHMLRRLPLDIIAHISKWKWRRGNAKLSAQISIMNLHFFRCICYQNSILFAWHVYVNLFRFICQKDGILHTLCAYFFFFDGVRFFGYVCAKYMANVWKGICGEMVYSLHGIDRVMCAYLYTGAAIHFSPSNC